MKKHAVKLIRFPQSGNTPILLILSISFLLGSISGCLLVNQLVGGGEDALQNYLNGYLSVACSGQIIRPEFWQNVFSTIRWPLIVLALGITPLGLIGIPVSFLIRGFLFSFSIASFFKVLGINGLVVSILIFGLSGLLYIPVFFHLGVQSYYSSTQLTNRLIGDKKKHPLFQKTFIRCIFFSFLLLVICASIEYSIIPQLVNSVAGLLIS